MKEFERKVLDELEKEAARTASIAMIAKTAYTNESMLLANRDCEFLDGDIVEVRYLERARVFLFEKIRWSEWIFYGPTLFGFRKLKGKGFAKYSEPMCDISYFRDGMVKKVGP